MKLTDSRRSCKHGYLNEIHPFKLWQRCGMVLPTASILSWHEFTVKMHIHKQQSMKNGMTVSLCCHYSRNTPPLPRRLSLMQWRNSLPVHRSDTYHTCTLFVIMLTILHIFNPLHIQYWFLCVSTTMNKDFRRMAI